MLGHSRDRIAEARVGTLATVGIASRVSVTVYAAMRVADARRRLQCRGRSWAAVRAKELSRLWNVTDFAGLHSSPTVEERGKKWIEVGIW